MTKEFEENGPSRFCLTPGTGLPSQYSSPCKGELPEGRGSSGSPLTMGQLNTPSSPSVVGKLPEGRGRSGSPLTMGQLNTPNSPSVVGELPEGLGSSGSLLTPGTGLPSQYSSPSKGEVPQRGGGVLFPAEEGVSDGRRCVLAESGISLKAIGRDLGLEVSVRDGELLTHPLPSMVSSQQMMWRKSLTINSSFCRAVVRTGYLSWQQMVDAVCRYRLGGTRSGRVIFWQIDNDERVCDGKVMSFAPNCHRRKEYSPTWVSALLTIRHGGKLEEDMARHCLFGLHLLHPRNAWLVEQSISACGNEPPRATNSSANADAAFAQRCHTTDDWQQRPRLATNDGCEILRGESPASQAAFAQRCHTTDDWQQRPVAVVEAEKTAVILSAYYPQYVWLATGGLYEVQPEKFRPLKGRRVILFPDADPDGKAYAYWYKAAQTVMAQPYWEGSPPIRVSALLEQHATPEQKGRKIDLVEFITE